MLCCVLCAVCCVLCVVCCVVLCCAVLCHTVLCFVYVIYNVNMGSKGLSNILTFTAHCLQSSSLKQCPMTSGHRVCNGLLFKSSHLSCLRLTQLSGKELSWLLYKSSRLSWLRLPKSFGSSTRAFLLKSNRTKWRRVQNASCERKVL